MYKYNVDNKSSNYRKRKIYECKKEKEKRRGKKKKIYLKIMSDIYI